VVITLGSLPKVITLGSQKVISWKPKDCAASSSPDWRKFDLELAPLSLTEELSP